MSATHLGVDFGTSHTVAALARPDGSVEPLLFDGSPLLPSAVHAEEDGRLIVGADALQAARMRPDRCEPHPKRRVDDGTVLLGEREYAVVELFAAVLSLVRRRCVEVAGAVPPSVTLTHPASWGPTRRQVLIQAASSAGLPTVKLMPEPVAAARYYTNALHLEVPVDGAVAVHDFGGGTFDASVVRRTSDGFEVLSVDGLDNLGGVDIDHALIDHVKPSGGTAPISPREEWLFREDARRVKESLSRRASAELYVPGGADVHVTREELDALAAPMLARAVTVTHAVVTDAGVPPESLAGVFLVGGASRMPLVATLLHRALGVAPVAADDLEQVVVRGAMPDARASVSVSAPPVSAPPAAPVYPPMPSPYPAPPVPRTSSEPLTPTPMPAGAPSPAAAVYPPPAVPVQVNAPTQATPPLYPPPAGPPVAVSGPPATTPPTGLPYPPQMPGVPQVAGPPPTGVQNPSPSISPASPTLAADSLRARLGPPALWAVGVALLFGVVIASFLGGAGDLDDVYWFDNGDFGSDAEDFLQVGRVMTMIVAAGLLLLHRVRVPGMRWVLVAAFGLASAALIVGTLVMAGYSDGDNTMAHYFYAAVAIGALELLFTDAVAEWYRAGPRRPVSPVTRWFAGGAVLALTAAFVIGIDAFR